MFSHLWTIMPESMNLAVVMTSHRALTQWSLTANKMITSIEAWKNCCSKGDPLGHKAQPNNSNYAPFPRTLSWRIQPLKMALGKQPNSITVYSPLVHDSYNATNKLDVVGITHQGGTPVANEELTPSLKNFKVLTCPPLLHPNLPGLVKQHYRTELQSSILTSPWVIA